MPVAQPTCPVCAGRARRMTRSLHRWRNVDWRLVRCRGCGHRYTDPMPDPGEVAAVYDDAYFDDGGDWVCGYWKGSYIENERNLRAEARGVLRTLRGPCRLLEIGCAGGYFLDEARRAGYDVTGVELNATQVEHARGLGLDVLCAPFESADLAAASFDLVIAQDVFEHICDPIAFFVRAKNLLRSSGSIVVRGPLEYDTRTELYGAIHRVRRTMHVVTTPPVHLQGFTPSSFHALCERTGMKVQRLDVSTHRVRMRERTFHEAVAQVVECAAYIADLVRGGGSFMVGEFVRQ